MHRAATIQKRIDKTAHTAERLAEHAQWLEVEGLESTAHQTWIQFHMMIGTIEGLAQRLRSAERNGTA